MFLWQSKGINRRIFHEDANMFKQFQRNEADRLVVNEYLSLLIIFFVASFLRILYTFYLKGNVPVDDAKGFDILGLNILKYHQYAFEPGVPTALRTPIYPLFLSGVYFVFGHSYFAVRVIQSIVGGLTCIVIYFIGKKAVNRNVGFIAAIISVFYPFFIYYTGYLLVETLLIFLLVVSVYWLVTSIEKPQWKNLGLSGIITGLAILCKPTGFAFLPFCLLCFVAIMGIRKLSTYRNIAIFLLFFVASLSPWVIRNYTVFKRIIVSDTHLGTTLLDGSLLFDSQHGRRMQ